MTAVVLQHNSCPVCGLPLMWKRSAPVGADMRWWEAQVLLRSLVVKTYRKVMSFGKISARDGVTATCFHFTDICLTRQLNKPLLYITPPRGVFPTEPMFYLAPNARHHRLFRVGEAGLMRMFRVEKPGFPRRARFFQEQLSIAGDRQMLSCAECNSAYYVGKVLKDLGATLYGARRGLTIDNVMYTILFDCMCVEDGDRAISVNRLREGTWQLQLWLLRSLVLLLAHNLRGTVNRTSTAYIKGFTRNCHTDIGLLDFLMSQILAAMIYAAYDIRVCFRELHQNYLLRLMPWLYREGFATPTVVGGVDMYPSSLCKWVLGYVWTGPPAPGLPSSPGAPRARSEHQDPYWIQITNTEQGIKTAADWIWARLMQFLDEWIPVLGSALSNAAGTHVEQNLFAYWNVPGYARVMETIVNEPVWVYGSLLDGMIAEHSMDVLERAFRAKFPPPAAIGRYAATPQYRKMLYGALLHVVVPRMDYYAACTRANSTANPPHNWGEENWRKWRAAVLRIEALALEV